jgi:hypothetical protein
MHGRLRMLQRVFLQDFLLVIHGSSIGSGSMAVCWSRGGAVDVTMEGLGWEVWLESGAWAIMSALLSVLQASSSRASFHNPKSLVQSEVIAASLLHQAIWVNAQAYTSLTICTSSPSF